MLQPAPKQRLVYGREGRGAGDLHSRGHREVSQTGQGHLLRVLGGEVAGQYRQEAEDLEWNADDFCHFPSAVESTLLLDPCLTAVSHYEPHESGWVWTTVLTSEVVWGGQITW